jgi:hypothetical protein
MKLRAEAGLRGHRERSGSSARPHLFGEIDDE